MAMHKNNDVVRVRSAGQISIDGHFLKHKVTKDMLNYCDSDVTIIDVTESGNVFNDTYKIKEDGGKNTWYNEMFCVAPSVNAVNE